MAQKRPLQIILAGSLISYSLIIVFNLIFPALLHRTQYIPLSSLFIFPSIILTAYAILKHRLLNIKSAESVILIFILLTVTFLQVIYSHTLNETLIRGGVFLLILGFSIFLLRTIINAEEQKERIELLANELGDANYKLIELNELKNKFTSLATHHIATPLTAIKGYVSLLQEGNYKNKSLEQKQTLKDIDRLTDSLTNVIRDFLDISRLENTQGAFDSSQVDLNILVNEVAQAFRARIEDKGLQFTYISQHDPLPITTDKVKLTQALSNILENSMMHTRSGEISLSASQEAYKYKIIITDTGYRNLPKTPNQLLNKFSRTGNITEANVIGSSLGLYLTKQLTEALGGDFRIIHEEEKDLTTFTVELFSESDIV